MSRKVADDRLAKLRAMPYDQYLLSPEWKERRKAAIDWARGACQLCNSPEEPLNVHHRTYDRLGAELPADLVVLCKDCHCLFHGIGQIEPPRGPHSLETLAAILKNITAIRDYLAIPVVKAIWLTTEKSRD